MISSSKSLKVCVTDVFGNAQCPHCSEPLQKAEYYTAKPISQQATQKDWNSKTITTTYIDVSRHVGGICLACADKSNKPKRTVGMALLLVGGLGGFVSMMVALVLSTIAERRGGDIGAAMGMPMALMCVFIIVAVVGLGIYLGARVYRPDRAHSRDALYGLLISRMFKEGCHPGRVYLSPAQAAKLTRA